MIPMTTRINHQSNESKWCRQFSELDPPYEAAASMELEESGEVEIAPGLHVRWAQDRREAFVRNSGC